MKSAEHGAGQKPSTTLNGIEPPVPHRSAEGLGAPVTAPKLGARLAVCAVALVALLAGAMLGGGSERAANASRQPPSTLRATSGSYLQPLVARLAAQRLPLTPVVPAPASARYGTAAACPANSTPGLVCRDVVVPLDRTGVVPGTIALTVETLPAAETPRGVMFLIAGGPGQGSAGSFALSTANAAAYYRFLFPGYTLVAYDDRGTGNSGFLDCPGIDGDYEPEQEPALVAACADSIGPTRVFYGTDEHADDLEAVRVALGAAKVGLWGTSYGTKLATAYALAYPGNVERLLLDSVLPPDESDPFRTKSAKAIPVAVGSLCASGACARATRNAVADLAQLANRLASRPISGMVVRANGSKKLVRMRGVELLSLVLEADLNPGIAVELPAVVRAALDGRPQPLLRVYDLTTGGPSGRELSAGLFAATVCSDGPFPWPSDTPPAARRALLDAAVAAAPAGSFGPFANWAAKIGNAEFCLGWPAPTALPWIGAGPLPDVPVLAVNGGFDMRTPPPGAQNVVSRFRQGRLIVVPGVGHSVLGADPTFCAARAVRQWMLGQTFSDQCARPRPFVPITPAYRAPLGAGVARPARTLAIASETLLEAQAMYLLASSGAVRGLAGGRLVFTRTGFRLEGYSTTAGIALTGKIDVVEFGPPLVFEGVVRVSGRSASSGLLGLADGKLGGTLGGVLVGRS